MKPAMLVLLVCSLLLNSFLLVQNYRRQIVISVPDGDSLQLLDGRRIRLLGVDAPEKGRCNADTSREYLRGLVEGKRVRLTDPVTDDFGRQLANVWLGRKLIQYDIVRNGMARYTSVQSSWKTAVAEAEDLAKEEKVGIHSAQCVGLLAPDSACTIKGNTRQGKPIYHVVGCPNYNEVIIDRAFGDEWFCSEEEAQAAGFIKAKGCR